MADIAFVIEIAIEIEQRGPWTMITMNDVTIRLSAGEFHVTSAIVKQAINFNPGKKFLNEKWKCL